MKMRFPIPVGLAALAALILGVVALSLSPRAAEEDKGMLANLISQALSSKTTNVSIGAVAGVLSSDATISDIVLSDRTGPWLKIDKVRLIWSRLALLRRRLEVDELTVGHLQFLRRPLPSETPTAANGAAQQILPELPLKVIVKKFGVADLSLGEPVIGVAARLQIAGKATLGPPSEGLDLSLTAKRLDAAGEFKADMTYVPATDKLTVAVNSDEPAGGLFVHLINLPGLPPAKLSFNGSGPLDKFDAKLDFSAGPDVWAKGDVTVARQDAGRRLTLNLNSRVEGMTPPIIRPVVAGDTTLKGDVFFNDDGTIATPGLHLVSTNARLDIEGARSADDTIGLKIHAGAIPGATQIGKLDLNASIVGPILSPTIDGAFDAGQIHVAEGSVDRVIADFHAAPDGALTEKATRIAFQGQAKVSGLSLADPGLRQAIGGDIALNLHGSATPEGDISFDTLSLAASDLDAHYSGLLAPKEVHGRLEMTANDLSRFAKLAGVSVKGQARIGADLEGAPRYGQLTAQLDAHATKLATGYPILDKVIGGELGVTGAARMLAGGGFAFADLMATGQHGSARLNGEYGPNKVALDARIDLPQAQILDPRVSGMAQIAATLTGKPDDLSAALKASLGAGRLLDRKTSGVTLEANANHLTGLLDASASLSGDIDRHPLRGSVHVAKTDKGGWNANQIQFTLASARLDGAVSVDADRIANGDLTFSASNLDDLSPLVLTKLSGAIEAKLSAAGANGRQSLQIVANSDRMAIGANRLEGLKVDLTSGDLWAARDISGLAQLVRAEIGGEAFSNLRLNATASGDASDIDVSGTARGLALKAHGRVTSGPPIGLDLSSFTAQGAGRTIALAGPATLTYGSDGVDIRNFALRIDTGRLSLSGHAGSTLDLRVNATALPLAAADLISPGLGLSGVAEGDAIIRGTPADPSGEWRVRLTGVSAPQMRSTAMPAVDVSGSGKLGGGRTTLDIAVKAGAANTLRVTGSAPLSTDGALDVRIDGRLDARLANNLLSASGRSVSGAVAIALQVRGPIAKPQAQGSIRLTGGEFRDDQTGFKLSSISATLVANGDAIRIDRFAGTTPNSGSITATGQVQLDPGAGFPGSIRLTARHAQIVSNDIVAATADMALTLTGRLGQKPNVAGRITVLSMDITVPGSFNSVASPIPGTKHINPTPTARARLAQLAKAEAGSQGPLFDATLALTVSAANRIFIHGRGIDAELQGNLHINGSARDPQVTGGFDLLRGSLSLLGKRLVFTRGRVRFHGDTMPDLDLVAETNATDITARIAVTGPAAHPTFSITSSPSLPEDEILSRVLFQKPSGGLSAFQALELANAVATLSGRADALEQIRKSLGFTSLNIGASSTGSPLVGVSRAINNRISVGVTTGARPQDNEVNVDLDVTRHIRLQAGVDASGGSSVGVGAEWEYK